MSLPLNAGHAILAETARVAHLVFPDGNVYLQMRDALDIVYEDASFEGLFSQKGQPGIAPWRLMLVSIMQYMEGLSWTLHIKRHKTRVIEAFEKAGGNFNHIGVIGGYSKSQIAPKMATYQG